MKNSFFSYWNIVKRTVLILIMLSLQCYSQYAEGTSRRNPKADKIPDIRSDFELSLTSVYFSTGSRTGYKKHFSVVKTAKGATAIYMYVLNYGGAVSEHSEIKLNATEWQNFANALRKSINNWREYYPTTSTSHNQWGLHIYFSDNEKLSFIGHNSHPDNWKEFEKIMEDIETKTKKGLITKMDYDYSSEKFRSMQEISGGAMSNGIRLRGICKKYLNQKPDFIGGDIVLKFTITPSGDVINISTLSNTTNNADFYNAVKDNLLTKWKWKAKEVNNTTAAIVYGCWNSE
jgi:hypothetical protein